MKVGDRVRVVGYHASYNGQEGEISVVNDLEALVHLRGLHFRFQLSNLKLVNKENNVTNPTVKKRKLKVGDIVEFINEDDHLIADEIIDISGDVYETIDYSDLKAGELKLIKSPERLKDNDYVITTQKNIYRVAEVGHQYYLFCAFNGVGAGNTELNSLPYLNSEGYYVIGGYQYKPIAIEKTEEE